MARRASRRHFLAAIAGVAAGLAGCGGPNAGTTATATPTATETAKVSPPATTTGDVTTPTGTPTTTPTRQGETTESGTATATATATSESGERTPSVDAVALEAVASGFRAPLDVAFAPDADRRYVVDQTGVIYVHESDGVRQEPFLDLRDSIVTGYEMGVLGLALHPDFAENRRAFVRYSSPPRSGTPDHYSHTFVLAEFEATDDGRRLDPDSERAVLEIPEPQGNHNAGDLAFGPDGHLYVAVGDGGAANDQGPGHVEDWYDGVGGGNGQDVTENLLGGILRIDVDGSEGGRAYAIPEDNPLVGEAGLDEYYAWGLRNPWRMSFDGETLIAGDVGQNRYEEVDVIEKGGNYGWNVMEGTHCFSAAECPGRTPDDVRGGEPLIDPVVEYPHSGGPVSGISVIGGYVYRGSAFSQLHGTYLFGDLRAGGRLFASTPGEGKWPTRAIDIAAGSHRLGQLLSFGRDRSGEVYALGTGAGDGWLHRIAPPG